MSQRDDKTIAFRPRARRDASPEVADEPVYEVDDVAVGPDGSVSPRPSGGELASPSTRARSHRRAHVASDAGEPTPLRPHPARTAPSAASTGDLHRARDAARSRAADARGADRSRRRGPAGAEPAGSRRGDRPAPGTRSPGAADTGSAKGSRESKGASAAARAGAAVFGGARSAAQRLTAAVTSAPRGSDDPDRSRRGRTASQDGADGQPGGRRRFPRPSRRALAVLAVAVVAVAALYGPVRDLYMAKRNNQILQDVLAEIDAENAAVEKRARDLTTEQGIEDEARLHGYVRQGEEAATVSGLPGDQEGEAVPIPDDVRASVLAREDPWYIQALDRLFLYQKGDQNHE